MKSLEELGISPAPWKSEVWQSSDDYGHDIKDGHNHVIANMFLLSGKQRKANANLMAESPKLYDCLREAVVEFCHNCEDTNIENCRGKCFVAKWRDAIARAGGEEV